jgi:hypothetical protein
MDEHIMKSFLSVTFSFTLGLLVAVVPAAAAGGSRQCLPKDIQGSWVMYGVLPVTENLAPNSAHQALRFQSDGSFLHVTSNNPLPEPQLDRLLSTKAEDHYTLDKDGVLVMIYYHGTVRQVALCAVATKPEATTFRNAPPIQHQTGDLVLTAYNAAAKPRFQMYFRKRAKTPVVHDGAVHPAPVVAPSGDGVNSGQTPQLLR